MPKPLAHFSCTHLCHKLLSDSALVLAVHTATHINHKHTMCDWAEQAWLFLVLIIHVRIFQIFNLVKQVSFLFWDSAIVICSSCVATLPLVQIIWMAEWLHKKFLCFNKFHPFFLNNFLLILFQSSCFNKKKFNLYKFWSIKKNKGSYPFLSSLSKLFQTSKQINGLEMWLAHEKQVLNCLVLELLSNFII